jgi:hypothetical protein
MRYLLIITLLHTLLFCAPALNQQRKFYNSNGTSFLGKAQGNQYLNWIETQEGNIVVFNQQTKNFEYAIIKNDMLVPNDIQYSKSRTKEDRNISNRYLLPDIYTLWRKKQANNHK